MSRALHDGLDLSVGVGESRVGAVRRDQAHLLVVATRGPHERGGGPQNFVLGEAVGSLDPGQTRFAFGQSSRLVDHNGIDGGEPFDNAAVGTIRSGSGSVLGIPHTGIYAAGKGAVMAFSKVLANELREERDGVKDLL